MRVVHVVNVADTGGAQTLVEALAAHRPPGTFAGIVVLGRPGVLSPRLRAAADHVEHLGIDPASWRLDSLLYRVRRAVRRLRPDVVHSHLLQSDLAVALLSLAGGLPARVSTVHTTGLGAADRPRSRHLARVMGRLSGRFTRTVACSRPTLDYLARTGYPAARTVLVENGVPLPPPAPPPPGGHGTLVSLSRWHPMKDHATLLAAFAELRSGHRLLLAGTGVTAGNRALVELVRRHGVRDRVELLGPVERPRSLLERADALVLSSAYGEALPMAGLEALAAGVPVVATDVGDCARLCAAPELLAPPGDPHALAAAMRHVIVADEPARRALSAASRRTAESLFDIRRTVRAYYDIYAEVTYR